MRLPHHLLRTPHGVFYFQIRVPRYLQASWGTKVIRRSLHTRDPVKARSYSYLWSLHYAQAFGRLQGDEMAPKISDILKAAEQGEIRRYDAYFDPATGNLTRIKTDGTQADHQRAVDYTNETQARRVMPRIAPDKPVPATAKPSKTVGAAFLEYFMTEAKALKPNTLEQRERAAASFVAAVGQNTPLRDVSRTMAAAWARDRMASGEVVKLTVGNEVSHVAQLFKAFKRWGDIDGDNPVKGVVVATKKEKRQRKLEGYRWEPFELDGLKKIFDPENLRKKKDHVQWAALIGLYTGARVGEVAQIFLRDFQMKEGMPCLLLRVDSDGQSSQKTPQSERTVPLHPDLIEMGLMERVATLRREEEKSFFPGMNLEGKAGPGNAISKGFSYYITDQLSLKPHRRNGTIGFNSLRKNVIQLLQSCLTLPPEIRRAFVGHETGNADVHEETYMREWTASELAVVLPHLTWRDWLDVEGLRQLLNE